MEPEKNVGTEKTKNLLYKSHNLRTAIECSLFDLGLLGSFIGYGIYNLKNTSNSTETATIMGLSVLCLGLGCGIVNPIIECLSARKTNKKFKQYCEKTNQEYSPIVESSLSNIVCPY